MKRMILLNLCIVVGLAAHAGLEAQPRPLAHLFPQLQGWMKQGKVETFLPETLYEHINGAAENFLAYDFRQLAVQNYVNGKKQSASAEIYFHGTPENAFGIYGSEKPLAGNYFAIGGQGYAEEGVLNFICDAYYVKLNSFDLGPESKDFLSALAEKIARAIGGKSVLPEILDAFPARGKIPNSERYILRNFLGHDFLHSAFVADYDLENYKFQLFIMRAGDENEARAMLQKYAALDKENFAPIVKPGALTIRDPYNGPIQLFWRGAFIWGVAGQTPTAAACLEAINEKLKKQ
jgi:hypothetical protein